MPPILPWLFFLAALIILGVVAPTIPDEPMHLSGVTVGAGLLLALVSFVLSLAGRRAQPDERALRHLKWATILSALCVLVTIGVLYARVLSRFDT